MMASRIQTKLPDGLFRYKSTPDFTPKSVPEALLSTHSVKSGVWGLLRVLRGRLRFYLDEDPPDQLIVQANGTVVIDPEALHHVELLDPDTIFRIEFHRAPKHQPDSVSNQRSLR